MIIGRYTVMIFRKGNEMWDAIKYCIYCLGIIISSAFGYNPEGLTWKTGVIGVVTCIVVLSVIYCITWLVCFMVNQSR